VAAVPRAGEGAAYREPPRGEEDLGESPPPARSHAPRRPSTDVGDMSALFAAAPASDLPPVSEETRTTPAAGASTGEQTASRPEDAFQYNNPRPSRTKLAPAVDSRAQPRESKSTSFSKSRSGGLVFEAAPQAGEDPGTPLLRHAKGQITVPGEPRRPVVIISKSDGFAKAVLLTLEAVTVALWQEN
jgi:hypothetical protein